ncbi:hypothetical protein FQ087_11990 [Sporosarcina sp. ANT_H38]|uniref:DUF6612 family protein n=1 Tax=Sporosarcina sp. ANT_H38 TaxID=2597358 RepID=UPI0011F24E90|nr:DUF6612 family protein [Sporosarcina sp. ANT_H38]KAA0966899.1 hypothetical protein FQ087_11990 [Sporosarcina sp. ANT_H38]
MKKIATWALAFVFALSFALPHGSAATKSTAMKFVVDGVEVTSYEQPFMSHDQVLIPVEDLFKEAGYKVSKDKSGKVNVTNTHLTVDFNAAASSILVNGKKADTEFPLTLQNAGNYVSGEFLATLEGFEVEVSEDKKTVNVKTNRVDTAKFLEKMVAADLKSYSSKMTLDQKMEQSAELGSMDMLMDIEMNLIQDPIALYMLSKLNMTIEGEKMEEVSETYFTKDGFFQKTGDKWIKFDDAMTEGLLQASIAQADPLAQLELTKKFTKGIHIFEYEDIYVMSQTLTNEEFAEMMEDAMSLITGILPVDVTEDSGEITTEAEATVTSTKDTAKDTAVKEEEATTVDTVKEVVTEETTETVIEEELEGTLTDLAINIEEYYVVTTIDKKTLFPIKTSGTTHMTMGIDEDLISIKQLITATFSDYNTVKEIKIPADVIKNAISMEEYIKQVELEFEKAEALKK